MRRAFYLRKPQGNLTHTEAAVTAVTTVVRASGLLVFPRAKGFQPHSELFNTLDVRHSITPMISSSRTIRSSRPSTLTSVPEYFPNRILSPTLT